MRKLRYMIVEHAASDANLEIVDNVTKGLVPIHHLLADYHGARLDANHVILVGSYSIDNHVALHSHPKVSVLPPMSSAKKIVAHMKINFKPEHAAALTQALSLDETHTMEDVIDKLETQYGPIFSSSK